jgi:hypothetical protein
MLGALVSGLSSLLPGVSSIVGGVGGLGGLGGLGGMDEAGVMDEAGGMDLFSKAKSEAVSGGTFTSGDVVFGKSDVLIIGAVFVLGLLILFRGKS